MRTCHLARVRVKGCLCRQSNSEISSNNVKLMPSPHRAKKDNPHGAKNHLRALDSHLQLDKILQDHPFSMGIKLSRSMWKNIRVLFDYFSVCGATAYPRDPYFHMVSGLCVGNEYYETSDSGYAFPLATRFRYVHFVFLSHLNWARLKAPTITASSLITQRASSSFHICDDNARLRL